MAGDRLGSRRGNRGSGSASDDDGQGENTDGKLHDEVPLYGFQMAGIGLPRVTKMVVQVTRTKFTFFNNIGIYFRNL